MKRYVIEEYEGRHDHNRFCVKYASTGNICLSALGQGYKSEQSAFRALCAYINECKESWLRSNMRKLLKENTELLNYLKIRYGKDGSDFKVKHVTEAREVFSDVDFGMTDKKFYNRFVLYMHHEL